ncbi:hypothetical protein [Rhizobium lentis]|uniref:hypothetical protein n=1 Tax=Rhizobium lentis TaxID=1138194 RepID=UPI002180CC41|nr:hypothetical protein [Rhizobium lentis]
MDEIVLAEFAGRILPFDTATASRAGLLPTADKRLSAFNPLGVECIDPWRFAGTPS